MTKFKIHINKFAFYLVFLVKTLLCPIILQWEKKKNTVWAKNLGSTSLSSQVKVARFPVFNFVSICPSFGDVWTQSICVSLDQQVRLLIFVYFLVY